MVIVVAVTERKPDLEGIIDTLAQACPSAGSIAAYIGFVKGVVEGHKVHSLDYEAYDPYAVKKLREIAEDYTRKGEACAVAIIHRVGSLKPGETTVYILVAAEPRDKAFKIAREILERVKREAPIFKLERRDDGEYWVLGDGTRIPRHTAKTSRASS